LKTVQLEAILEATVWSNADRSSKRTFMPSFVAPLVAAALYLALPQQAWAQATEFFVAKNGSNLNPCSSNAPCLTIQAAVKKVAPGILTNINIGAGTYDIGLNDEEQINVVDYRRIHFNGQCPTRRAVVLRGHVPGPIMWAQHYALIIANCLTFKAAPGIASVIGISVRKFSLVNWRDTRFEDITDGTHVAVTEQSSGAPQNLTELTGNPSVHLAVTGMSFAHVPSASLIDMAPLTVEAFAVVDHFSKLDAAAARFSGGPVAGRQYINNGGLLIQPPGGLPGDRPGEVYDNGIVK
jgi:hypothetical protein